MDSKSNEYNRKGAIASVQSRCDDRSELKKMKRFDI